MPFSHALFEPMWRAQRPLAPNWLLWPSTYYHCNEPWSSLPDVTTRRMKLHSLSMKTLATVQPSSDSLAAPHNRSLPCSPAIEVEAHPTIEVEAHCTCTCIQCKKHWFVHTVQKALVAKLLASSSLRPQFVPCVAITWQYHGSRS